MTRTTAPYDTPKGKRWCARHSGGKGAFLDVSLFPPQYGYCYECKREYQRKWDKEIRKRPPKIIQPSVRLSQKGNVIIVHLPNDEKGRNITRMVLERYPNANSYL